MAQPVRQYTEEEIRQLAEKFMLSPDNRHFKSFLNPPKTIPTPVDYDTTIIKHIKGSGTGRFPTKEEFDTQVKVVSEEAKREYEDLIRKMPELKEIPTPTQPMLDKESDFFSVSSDEDQKEKLKLPICEKNNTTREIVGDKQAPNANQVTFDVLWLPEGLLLPPDLKAAFGEKTLVEYYMASNPDEPTKTAISLQVDCLPYRIRVTNSEIYHDRGINAVMNYDADYTKKGVLHETVKMLLSGSNK